MVFGFPNTPSSYTHICQRSVFLDQPCSFLMDHRHCDIWKWMPRERCLTSLALREMQIKTTVPISRTSPPLQCLWSEKDSGTRWWEYGQVGVFMCCRQECRNGWVALEKLVVPSEVKQRATVWPSNFTPGFRPKKIENTSTQNLNTSVHWSMIYPSPELEVTQLSIRWWMDKLNEVLFVCQNIIQLYEKAMYWFVVW